MKSREITIPFFFIEEQKNGKQICITGKEDKSFYPGDHFDTWDCKEYGFRSEADAKRAIIHEKKRLQRLGICAGILSVVRFDIIFLEADAKNLHLIQK